MVHFEIEFVPVASGFLTGAAIFFLQRCLTRRSGEKGAEGKEEFLVLDPPESELPSLEPAPEPGSEPVLAREAHVQWLPAAARSLRWQVLHTVALTVLGLGLLFATILSRNPGPSPWREPFSTATASSFEPVSHVQVTEVSAFPEPLPSEDHELAAAQLENAEPANLTAEAKPTPAAPAAEEKVELQAAVALSTSPAQKSGRGREEQPAGKNVLTMNLTRQEMTLLSETSPEMQYKSAYWANLDIGTPAVTFRVVFDTGSGHLILPSSYCHSSTCRAHKRYRRSKSSSARDINYDGEVVQKGDPRDQLTVNFGTGEVVGVFVEELVCLRARSPPGQGGPGPSASQPLRMIAATSMSEDPFKTFEFDGVLGLSLPGLSEAPEFNFIHVLKPALEQRGSAAPNVFSVFLAQHAHEQSEITLGGYLDEHIMGKLAWNPVIHPQLGHWMVRIKSIRVDNQAINYCRHGCRAVVDSGTSLLAVPTDAFPEIYGLLRHEADPVHHCRGKGPKLRMELENFALVLEPKDYAKRQIQNQAAPRLPTLPPNFVRNESVTSEPAICKPLLMTMNLPAPVGPKLFILGEPVLRKYYTVYDSADRRPRIGFARARHAAAPSKMVPLEAAPLGSG